MKKESEKTMEEIENTEIKDIDFVSVRPGGNDTALCIGMVDSPEERKVINDAIMLLYPNVEQVGFINPSIENAELMMAGGEFCGNATRSTAWKILNGKPGEIEVKVSGVAKKLNAGVTAEGEAYAQMPVYKKVEKLSLEKETGNYTVQMEGITHNITFDAESLNGLTPEEIKQKSLDIIRSKGLDKYPASGVIYCKSEGNGWKITPVVYVRDINTLFLETACGSGTTALGLVLALREGKSIDNVPIVQPTGRPIKVSVEFNGESFGYTQISGPIEKLTSAVLEIDPMGIYSIEPISSLTRLRETLQNGGLTRLYQDIFGQAPYFEKFSDQEVEDIFKEYVNDGILFLAKDTEGIIGFGASLPIDSVPEIKKIISPKIDVDENCWYMADLGVKSGYRRRGIGKRLVLASTQKGSLIVMRTSINNTASQSLFRSIGYQDVPEAFQEVDQARIDGTVISDQRLFLFR